MAISFDAFVWSITQQESGGNYKALGIWLNMPYGRDRAYGRYQVMGANIPDWTAKYYGKRLTPQQYLNNRAAQDAVVRGRLKSYVDKYGYRGAASAWYSGNPNLHMSTRPQKGGPSIKGYVDSVMGRAGRYPGGSGKSSGGSVGGGGSPAKASSPKATAEDYGFVLGLLNSYPELKKLFKRAVDKGWDPSKFQAEIRDTKWWKTHSQAERDYLVKRYGDPASAKQDYNQAYIRVRQMANSMGLRETPGNKKRLSTWAYNMAAKGWDEAQLRNEIGKYVYFNNDTWQGEGGETQEKLRSAAYAMGVKMSGQWYADKTRNVLRGLGTVQDYEDEIRRQAKALFPHWGKQIDAGQTVLDLASPYMQSMAQILELPGGSLNLFDPTIKKALTYKDPKSGKNTVKPLWQFENELRNDPRWRKTTNAQNSLMQVAHQVLADFGVKY